jgi:hypothetical protein
MNKWSAWYDSLPEHTKRYLDKQAVWHDRDLFVFGFITFVIGIFVGKAF